MICISLADSAFGDNGAFLTPRCISKLVTSFSLSGSIGGLVSLSTYYNNRGIFDVIYLIPAAISGVILVSGMVLLGTTTNKYQNILEVKKAKGG